MFEARGELAEKIDGVGGESDLFVGLAEGGGAQVEVGRLGLAPGERDLTRVVAQVVGAAQQPDMKGGVADKERDQHGGGGALRGLFVGDEGGEGPDHALAPTCSRGT